MRIRQLKGPLSFRIVDHYNKLLFSVVAVWFAVRVIPKPSRITYPCQRSTLGLLLMKTGIAFSAVVTSTTSLANRKSVKAVSIAALLGVLLFDPLTLAYYQYRYANSPVSSLALADVAYNFPTNRVVRVHSSNATSWDFGSLYYWECVDQSTVDRMVEEGVKALTGTSNAQAAWSQILPTYQPGHKVGIKVNGNDWWNTDNREIDSIPQIMNSVIKGLKSIGVPETSIYIIENTHPVLGYRKIPNYYESIVTALYPSVVFQYDTNTGPSFGTVPGTEVNFPYMPSKMINDQIASLDHLILMPIMKAITPIWGITGTIKLMQGVIQDPLDFHDQLGRSTADNPNVLIYENQHIIGKTRLIIGDGLFGAWTGQHFTGGFGGIDVLNSEVNDVPKPWITFGNKAPNSLFFAADPVAVDSVMYDHILRERYAQDQVAGQSLAPFSEPQLLAGAAAGLGIREHGPPYVSINYMELEVSAAPLRDVAVIEVVASPLAVFLGELVNASVVIKNEGSQDENCTVSIYANSDLISTVSNVTLTSGSSTTLNITWDTGGFAKGVYAIEASVAAIVGETDTTDNRRTMEGLVVLMIDGHDVAVFSVTSKSVVCQGYLSNINAGAVNVGSRTETFTVSVYIDSSFVASRSVTLESGNYTVLGFVWNTTGLSKGTYVPRAVASSVFGETDTTNNLHVNGSVTVSMVGDVSSSVIGVPDGKVDIRDVALVAKAFGSFPGYANWNQNADITNDGKVDIRDIAVVAKNYGRIDP